MAPKLSTKVLKTKGKAKAKAKATVVARATGSSPKAKAKAQGQATPKAKAKAKSAALTLANVELASQATDTLNDKLARLRASNSMQELHTNAKSMLSKNDRSSMFIRARSQMGRTPEMKEEWDAANSKSSKTQVLLKWQVDPTGQGSIHTTSKASVSTDQKTTKTEHWVGWQAVVRDGGWTEPEAVAHLQSGRILERETTTSGVYEYLDSANFVYERSFLKRKEMEKSNIVENDKDDISFEEFFDSLHCSSSGGTLSLGQDAWEFGYKGASKGGPGQVTLVKGGKAKGKGGGPPAPQPAPPEPKTEAQLLEAAWAKARQCLTLLEKQKALNFVPSHPQPFVARSQWLRTSRA